MATQTQTQTSEPGQDHSSRQRSSSSGSCSPTRRRSAKRRWRTRFDELRSQASDSAAAGGKRRPRRRPSRQGVGADDHRPARTRRRQAVARVPAGCWGAISRKARTRSAPSTTMRFVFFDNDTRLLFATAFDGDWDTYIDDFVAKIPDYLDIIDSAWDGWPGIRIPGAKDYLVKHQITAEGWYVAYPDLTVAEIHAAASASARRWTSSSTRSVRQQPSRSTRKEKAAMATQTAAANQATGRDRPSSRRFRSCGSSTPTRRST